VKLMADGEATSTVAETHISRVFFSDDRAYKILKPLATSFLDHSTAAARLRAIDQELALNRRLAPDVYLGTADVVEDGDVVDRMLVMRRLPSDRRLSNLIARGRDTSECVRSIARAMAAFHSRQQPDLTAGQIASRDAMRKNWHDNFTDIQPVVGSLVPEVESVLVRQLADDYLDHGQVLFDQRLADGLVRDGHGDLTAEDIFCMDDGPRILDCLAFDPRLRIGDVLLDVAFLAMDLDRLIDSEAAQAFIDAYCEYGNEHHPASLAHHFIAYRASVRAKVAAIRYAQGDTSQEDLVRTYHQLCLRHLQGTVRHLVLIGGTPGTGKSTLARAMSDSRGYVTLGSDELRKDLVGRGHLETSRPAPDEGIYRRDITEQTYGELLTRAGLLLERGESVILDASWSSDAHRQQARTLAEHAGARLVEIECVVTATEAKRRIESRLEAANDPSDAYPELVDDLRQRFETWTTAVRIDTASGPDRVLAQALERLG
jgi:uncharacterized protein